MSDSPLSPLPDDLRGLLGRVATIAPAPTDARIRVLERVEALLPPAGGPTGGGGGAGGNVATESALEAVDSAPRGSFARWALPCATFVAGVSVAGWLFSRGPAHDSLSPIPIEPSAAATAASEPERAVLPPLESSVSPDESAPHAAAPPAAAGGVDTFAAEKKLVDRARGALAHGDPAAALEAASRHKHLFPSGVLTQEREAVAIRALVRLGRTSEARARAERFRVRFPTSVLLPAMEAIADSTANP